MRELLTALQLANRLHLSRAQIYKLIRAGRWPVYRFGKRVVCDLEEVLAATRAEPTPTEGLIARTPGQALMPRLNSRSPRAKRQSLAAHLPT